MSLHRLASITLGVPDVATVSRYYEEFGLVGNASGTTFSTTEGGEQLRLAAAPSRRLLEAVIGADDEDDVERAAAGMTALGCAVRRSPSTAAGREPATGVRFTVTVRPRLHQSPPAASPVNAPGRIERPAARTPGILREGRVRPRRLGHVVLGTTAFAATLRFLTEGVGFRVSDLVSDHGAFLRCSTDHHNLLIQQAPVPFVHHSAWQVEDIDEIGRGAMAMLEGHPERHVWGLGRHYAGSNFFWYLRDPAGTFSEYYSDLDDIGEDALWTPQVLEGARGLFSWGPPPPPSFIHPEDLAGLMTGSHIH